MNYSEITTLALGYSDRQDDDVIDRIDDFLRIVEARINRAIDVQKMSIRTEITTQADKKYYGLPSDFNGLRDIEIYSTDTPNSRDTLSYASPEQMNDYSTNTTNLANAKIFYTIIANQLHIYPPQEDKQMEIVYFRKIPPLGATNNENWLSIDFPDLYVNGLLVEINSFVKDAEAAMLWDQRFNVSVNETNLDDKDARWSGPALVMRTG